MRRRLAAIAIGLAMITAPGFACTDDAGRHPQIANSVGREVTIRPPMECQREWQMSLNLKILEATDAPPNWHDDVLDDRHGIITVAEAGVVTYVDADDGTTIHFAEITSLGPPCS